MDGDDGTYLFEIHEPLECIRDVLDLHFQTNVIPHFEKGLYIFLSATRCLHHVAHYLH